MAKHITVVFMNDPIGCSGISQEGEFKEFQKEFTSAIGSLNNDITVDFVHIVNPMQAPVQYDFFFFDYGGLGIGATSMVDHIFKGLDKEISDKPNALFVCLSGLNYSYFGRLIAEEYGDTQPHNLLVCGVREFFRENKSLLEGVLND